MKTKALNLGKTFLKHELVNKSLYLLIALLLYYILAYD